MRPFSQLSKLARECQQSRDKLNIQIFQFQYAVTVGGREEKIFGKIFGKYLYGVVFMILIGIVRHVRLVSAVCYD